MSEPTEKDREAAREAWGQVPVFAGAHEAADALAPAIAQARAEGEEREQQLMRANYEAQAKLEYAQGYEAAKAEKGWACKARTGFNDPPQDCDWPHCGCDPAAQKVLDALEEEGLADKIRREGYEAGLKAQHETCCQNCTHCEDTALEVQELYSGDYARGRREGYEAGQREMRERLDEVERDLANALEIPSYAYGDNQAACEFAHVIQTALAAIRALIEKVRRG